MKRPAQHIIVEVPRRRPRVEMTIGIDLGDVWSHYCTLNQDSEVVDRGRFKTTSMVRMLKCLGPETSRLDLST